MNAHPCAAPWVRVLAAVKRPTVLQLFEESGVLAHWISSDEPLVPEGSWEPLVIDVETYEPLPLVKLLAQLNMIDQPVLALVDPASVGAKRLLVLCRAVTVIADNPRTLAIYLRSTTPIPRTAVRRVWLRVLPPRLPLADADILRIIATLAEAPTMEAAAEQIHIARRTLFRRLQDFRHCLGVACPDAVRHSPLESAQALIAGYYREGGGSSIQVGT